MNYGMLKEVLRILLSYLVKLVPNHLSNEYAMIGLIPQRVFWAIMGYEADNITI